MIKGILGKKLGMTQVFAINGQRIPVTVVEAGPCVVLQKKTAAVDGYDALQVGFGPKKTHRTNKPSMGHFKKAGKGAFRHLRELQAENIDEYNVGDEISCEGLFSPGDIVDVTGTSKGKGFAGTVKRHNFCTQDATHGNSLSHRTPGSIGQNQTPGRVFKGKKMSGHLGNVRRTAQNLEIVRVDAERNLLLVKGAVPGSKGGDVIVRPAVKARS